MINQAYSYNITQLLIESESPWQMLFTL